MMEIREWAEQILWGQTLADKLRKIKDASDLKRGQSIQTPLLPRRPKGLEFSVQKKGAKNSFLSIDALREAEKRGKTLHIFCNHELMALELMALCLLKFPESPLAFRKGLVQTMEEEQGHMKMYLNRMKEFGIEFGSLPVSDFFWRAISPMKSPMDYVTGISLTFEQANIDFAKLYSKAFHKLGDSKTAQIMEQIYQEEIGHVAHGLKWFRKWKKEGESDWEAYLKNLHSSINPRRARGGLEFDELGRLQAGLTKNFIDRLYVFSYSLARPSDVYFHLDKDFYSLPMILAKEDDVVLVHKKPTPKFLKYLKEQGFFIPQFVLYQQGKFVEERKASFLDRSFASLRPWKWSKKSIQTLQPLFSQLPSKNKAKISLSKIKQISSLASSFCSNFLGEHSEFQDWLCHSKSLSKNIILNLSWQMERDGHGKIRNLGIWRFIETKEGHHLASIIAPTFANLNREIIRGIFGDRGKIHRLHDLLEKVALHLEKELSSLNYQGPLEVRALLNKTGKENFSLNPIVAIHFQYTFGNLALKLKNHIVPKRAGIWLTLSISQIQEMGFPDFKKFADTMEKKYPIELCKKRGTRIYKGILFTTDPENSANWITCLVVGKNLEECAHIFPNLPLNL